MLKAAVSIILFAIAQTAVQQHIDAAKKAAGTQWSAAADCADLFRQRWADNTHRRTVWRNSASRLQRDAGGAAAISPIPGTLRRNRQTDESRCGIAESSRFVDVMTECMKAAIARK